MTSSLVFQSVELDEEETWIVCSGIRDELTIGMKLLNFRRSLHDIYEFNMSLDSSCDISSLPVCLPWQ